MKGWYPLEIDSNIEKLLDLIDSEFEPEIIPVIVEEYSQLESCYFNVQKKIERDGGKIHYGWDIWYTNNMCEAEHHAVWENDQGDLIDVTPKQIAVSQVMFVPDSRFIFEGKTIDNIRLNIKNNILVDHMIVLSKAITVLLNTGDRKDELALLMPDIVAKQIEYYTQLRHNIELFLDSGGRYSSMCYCKSTKSYGKCHGKDLKLNVEQDVKKILQYIRKS